MFEKYKEMNKEKVCKGGGGEGFCGFFYISSSPCSEENKCTLRYTNGDIIGFSVLRGRGGVGEGGGGEKQEKGEKWKKGRRVKKGSRGKKGEKGVNGGKGRRKRKIRRRRRRRKMRRWRGEGGER